MKLYMVKGNQVGHVLVDASLRNLEANLVDQLELHPAPVSMTMMTSTHEIDLQGQDLTQDLVSIHARAWRTADVVSRAQRAQGKARPV
jgi:hypothetical protein